MAKIGETTWTPAMDARLSELYGDADWPTRRIAEDLAERFGMAMTRNAVIGRAKRLGINDPTLARERKPKEMQGPPLPPPSAETTMRGGGCRWPLWAHSERPTHVFCGAPRHVLSAYCPHHRGISVERVLAERTWI